MRINPSTGKIVSRDDNYCPECDGYLEDNNYQWCDHCNAYVGIVSNGVAGQSLMVDCLNCGTKNDIRNNYCTNCGENPTDNIIRCNPNNPTIDGLEVICDYCGVYNQIRRKTCYNCGENLNINLNID